MECGRGEGRESIQSRDDAKDKSNSALVSELTFSLSLLCVPSLVWCVLSFSLFPHGAAYGMGRLSQRHHTGTSQHTHSLHCTTDTHTHSPTTTPRCHPPMSDTLSFTQSQFRTARSVLAESPHAGGYVWLIGVAGSGDRAARVVQILKGQTGSDTRERGREGGKQDKNILHIHSTPFLSPVQCVCFGCDFTFTEWFDTTRLWNWNNEQEWKRGCT